MMIDINVALDDLGDVDDRRRETRSVERPRSWGSSGSGWHGYAGRWEQARREPADSDSAWSDSHEQKTWQRKAIEVNR